jgi:hypothetical protein
MMRNVICASCPSCGKEAKFHYIGEQKWPVRIARAAGFPPILKLWLCSQCESTISEPSLKVLS